MMSSIVLQDEQIASLLLLKSLSLSMGMELDLLVTNKEYPLMHVPSPILPNTLLLVVALESMLWSNLICSQVGQ